MLPKPLEVMSIPPAELCGLPMPHVFLIPFDRVSSLLWFIKCQQKSLVKFPMVTTSDFL